MSNCIVNKLVNLYFQGRHGWNAVIEYPPRDHALQQKV